MPCSHLYNDQDILNNFANLSNYLVVRIQDELSSKITAINSPYYNLICKLKRISDSCTITLKLDSLTKQEKTLTVLVRHLIDNIISHFIFADGIDLLHFINGTRVITDILCLDTTLYDDTLLHSTTA